MKQILIPLLTMLGLSACSSATAQSGEKLFADNCLSCHGSSTVQGSAPSLFDGDWKHGADRQQIKANITNGIESAGMPAFNDAFSEAEISSLVSYMLNQDFQPAERDLANVGQETILQPLQSGLTPAVDGVVNLKRGIKQEDYIKGLDEPWGFAFLGMEDVLVTEKSGKLLYISHLPEPIEIKNIPTVNKSGQGGLLDVAIDPDYLENKWVYLTYSHPLSGKSGPSMTKLVRGRIENFSWVDEEVLFEAKPEHYVSGGRHFGSRITFDDVGHIYFSIGDRGNKDQAQDTNLPNGKVHRLKIDGSIPDDNPFVSGAYPSIFSYGNRNPQGLIWNADTGVLWSTEHGPRGGDELNAIKSGQNYGWPEISYGINYNGTELTPFKAKSGMAQPVSQWTPSIAACGLDVYTGDLFPQWKGRLLAGSLAYQSLRLIEIDGESYVDEIEILKDEGRIRDVTTGPDGAIYVALPKKIVRLSPAQD